MPKYKRIILKLSGEMFGGEDHKGLDFAVFNKVAKYISDLKKENDIDIAIVLGGGNLFRGRELVGTDFDNVTADSIGMLGTVMNALALHEELDRLGCHCRVMSSLAMDSVCEPFIRRKALRHLQKGRVVILAGGTGSPFFTTDSAAALKACELKCDIVLKGSNVNGVYDADPKKNPQAKMYKKLSFKESIEKGLMVMDNTAFALCHNEKIPIVVFNLDNLENIGKIIAGEEVGTLIT